MAGADERPAVLFCSGLGGAASFWAPQTEALGDSFQIITYDHRGTGTDRSPLPEGYSIADMADEAAAVLDSHGIATCHFVGHALGGAIGLELARRHPGRIGRLVAVNGWASMDPHTERCFEARMALLDHCGVAQYVRAQAIFLYPAAWISANADRVAAEDVAGVSHFQGAGNLRIRVAALRAWDPTGYLAGLDVDILALAARDDVLVPWTASRALANAVRKGRLELLAEGGHACTVTAAAKCNAILASFLAPGLLAPAASEQFRP